MQIDKAGRDDLAGDVQVKRGRADRVADLGDAPGRDGDVRDLVPARFGVDDASAVQHDVG